LAELTEIVRELGIEQLIRNLQIEYRMDENMNELTKMVNILEKCEYLTLITKGD